MLVEQCQTFQQINDMENIKHTVEHTIKRLVKLFDSDTGYSEELFDIAYDMIELMFGTRSACVFSKSMHATEGHFYLKKDAFEIVWERILVAKQS